MRKKLTNKQYEAQLAEKFIDLMERENNQPKHTQGEWKANPLTNPTKPEYYCIYVKPGGPETVQHIVTVTSNGLNNKEEVHANAQRIVRAVNMHDELIKELAHLKRRVVFLEGFTEDKTDPTDLTQVNKLLKQAEGK